MGDGDGVNPSPVVASSGPDGFNIPVALASNNRCYKLCDTAAQDAIGNRDYGRRLRRQSESSTPNGSRMPEEADCCQTTEACLSFIFSALPEVYRDRVIEGCEPFYKGRG